MEPGRLRLYPHFPRPFRKGMRNQKLLWLALLESHRKAGDCRDNLAHAFQQPQDAAVTRWEK
jgi:hypothetical protein